MSPTQIPGIPYYPDPPRVQAVTGTLAFPPPLIVIHDTGNPTANASQEAHNAANRTDDQGDWTAAHAYVDANGPLGSLPLTKVAWSAYHFANIHGWHLEACGVDAGDANAVPAVTWGHMAALVRKLVAIGGQTIQHLGPADIAAIAAGNSNKTGITGHRDITLSGIDQNTHSDPGAAFNWGWFIGLVQASGSTTATEDDDVSYNLVPEGVAFNADNSWADMTKAMSMALPQVSSAAPRWVYVAGNQNAVVRLVYNGGGWNGVDATITATDGGHVFPLPAGTTQLFIGYKSGTGATFMVKGA